MRRRIRAAAMPIHRHSLPQMVVDGALVALAYYLAFELRFNHGPHGRYALLRDRTLPWVVLAGLLVLVAGRVYERQWRYSSQRDYLALGRGVLVLTVLTVLGVAVLHPVVVSQGGHLGGLAHSVATHGLAEHGLAQPAPAPPAPQQGKLVGVDVPNGVSVLFLLLCLSFLVGLRAVARSLHERRPLAAFKAGRAGDRSVLIAGAGDGGRLVLREILRNRELGLVPVGFLDDDPRKHGLRIDGVRVHGDTREQLARILDEAEPDEVIIAIPSAPGSTRARIVRACRERGVQVRTLPTVFELLRDQGATRAGTIARQVREVRVEDVLGREPVHVELRSAGAYLAGETVLVTGAGGSIGSELCRQIAQVRPRRLVLIDHAEDNLFAIASELEQERHVPPAALRAVLADCKEEARMKEVFAEHAPAVVFHAAAYKHVGLMEANPIEAVRNNALATRLVAMLAGEHGAERFVLVSTDKAVSPATVMGASKALAELALEAASSGHPDTRYAAVRFGNVLGSSGSVVPIFRRQIERGGPVTVTDERMERYFMTIPEAVQLIIRSGSLASPLRDGRGMELFVLDMGEPVKIVDLARAMIELSGLEPARDIEIEIVGARPGEKLAEELFADHERLMATEAEKIMRVERRRPQSEAVATAFGQVEALVAEADLQTLCSRMASIACSPWTASPSPVPANHGSQDGAVDATLDGAPDGPFDGTLDGDPTSAGQSATVRLRPS